MDENKVRQIFRDELDSFLKSDRFVFYKKLQILDGRNIQLGQTNGTKIGISTTDKLAFFNKTPIAQQTDGAGLTNNVTVGGSNDIIADFSDLTTYSNSAATIRNDIYQLARKVKIIGDALRLFGFLS